jgi:transcriptional regulator with XRE-family HTH domain
MPKGQINPIDKHVGSRVRMRRLMLNMSQGEIAAMLGLTFQQVQKYESGANRISASRLQQLCEILQVGRLGAAFGCGPPATTHSFSRHESQGGQSGPHHLEPSSAPSRA